MQVKCKRCGLVMKIRRVEHESDWINSPLAIVFACYCGTQDLTIYSRLFWNQQSDTEIIRYEDDIEASIRLSA